MFILFTFLWLALGALGLFWLHPDSVYIRESFKGSDFKDLWGQGIRGRLLFLGLATLALVAATCGPLALITSVLWRTLDFVSRWGARSACSDKSCQDSHR